MMKQKSRHTSPPDLKNARKLTALELNSLRYENKHTLLTPAQLEVLARASRQDAE